MINSSNLPKETIRDFKLLGFYVAVIWIIEIANQAFQHGLNQYGLVPREFEQIYGVITVHFLHWGFGHLISNTLPLLFLGSMVCLSGQALRVSISIAVISGIAVWIFARSGTHVGASGLVMGYWGYLISKALFDRSLKNLLIGIITIALYGGIVFSLFDFRASVSFEGHLFGFASGVLVAWGFSRLKANN